MAPSPINVGVIGAGRIGRIHGQNLAGRLAGARLVAVADIDRSAAERCGADLDVRSVYHDPRRLIEDRAVEAVVVCSSTDTHAQLIEDIAAAHKHVFCEKPIDNDLARVDRALRAAEHAGIKLQIGFNRRFDPGFRSIGERVSAGQIGAVHIVRITSRDPEPPPAEYVRRSGGIFLDMTIHDFDMARYLSGAEITAVQAIGAVRIDPTIGAAGDFDTTIVMLEFENGAIGSIDNSRRAVYGYDQRVEVFGSAGMLWADNALPHRTGLADADGVRGPAPLYFFLERYQASFLAEMESFIECIRRDERPLVSGNDGRAPIVAAIAAGRSARERRRVELCEVDPKRLLSSRDESDAPSSKSRSES